MSESLHDLKHDLSDPEYRHAYAEDFLNTSIATQIKVLREKQKMTQAELGAAIGTQQAGISRLENVNYSAWKTETLRRLARAFDVRLRITFEQFGTLLEDAANFSAQNLERERFSDDPLFSQVEMSVPSEHLNEAVLGTIPPPDIRENAGEQTLEFGLGSIQPIASGVAQELARHQPSA